MTDTIALKKLRLSPHNVRKSDTDSQIEPLAQSIAAHGLLSNLLVTASPKKSGYFDVIAGGRRLRALLLLVARGTLKTSFLVPVTILEGSDAHLSETSLAENYHRLAMSPADECRAFAHFLGELGNIDAVAIRFGQTRRQIEARLRLAALAEPIFAELAAGKMTLDCAKAYGATSDHARQIAVFAQLNGTWQSNNASTIRQAILHGAVRGNDALALYVGQDDYVAASGRIERELFGDDDSADWIDPEVLSAVATTRMAALCEEVRVRLGIGWVTPVLEVRVPWEVTQPLHQYYPPRAAPDDSEHARIAVIEAEQVTLGDQLNSLEDEDACALLQSRYDTLEAELHALEAARSAIGEDIKPLLGQFLTLSSEGTPRLDPRLFSKTRIGGSGTVYVPPADTVKLATKAQGLSDRLVSELAVQRRDILAANLAGDPALALDLALFIMADAYGSHSSTQAKSTISARTANDPFLTSQMPDTLARTHLGEIFERLDRSWCDNSEIAARFDAFRACPDIVRADWLSYSVAKSLECSLGVPGAALFGGFHNHLGQLLGIAPANWWRPTVANYFGRVKKAAMIKTLETIGGAALASRYSAAKSGELAMACEKLCSGTAIVEAEVREAALAWMPPVMTFDAVAGADADLGGGNADAGDDPFADDNIDDDHNGDDHVGDDVDDHGDHQDDDHGGNNADGNAAPEPIAA